MPTILDLQHTGDWIAFLIFVVGCLLAFYWFCQWAIDRILARYHRARVWWAATRHPETRDGILARTQQGSYTPPEQYVLTARSFAQPAVKGFAKRREFIINSLREPRR